MFVPRLVTMPVKREIQLAGTWFAAIAAATGIAAILAKESEAVDRAAIFLLCPLVMYFVASGIATTLEVVRSWRERTLAVRVRRAMADLGEDYHVVSSTSSPLREDHIAIGPNGVFVVVACDDGGRVTASAHRLFVNARRPWRALIEDCRIEALRVGERVRRSIGRPVPVHAVLCFTRALVAVGQEVRGVKIVQLARLPRVIASTASPSVLSLSDRAAAEAAVTVVEPIKAVRPVFRVTPKRKAPPAAERPLRLIGRAPSRHHRVS